MAECARRQKSKSVVVKMTTEEPGTASPEQISNVTTEFKQNIDFSVGEFVQRMTCHGLQDVYAATSKFSIAFWTFILFACLAVLSYSVYECFREFYVSPIRTTIHVVPSRKMTFPDIVICPSNFVDYDKMTEATADRAKTARIEKFKSSRDKRQKTFKDDNTGLLFKFGKSSNDAEETAGGDDDDDDDNDNESYEYYDAEVDVDGELNSSDITSPDTLSLSDEAKEVFDASIDYDALIRETYLVGGTYTWRNESDDTYGHVTLTLTENGVCYVMNMTNALQVAPGMFLQLLIDLNTELDHPTDPNMVAPSDGIMILTGSPNYHPVMRGGTLIPPETHARLSLSVTDQHLISVTRFTQKPQVCVEQGDVNLTVINSPYSAEACDLDCTQMLATTYFNCLIPMNLSFVRSEILEKVHHFCFNYELHDTLWQNDSLIDLYNDCRSKCERQCEQTKYTIATSAQKIPSQRTLQLLEKNADYVLQVSDPPNCGDEYELTWINAEFNNDTCRLDCMQKVALEIVKCRLPMDYDFLDESDNEVELCNETLENFNLSPEMMVELAGCHEECNRICRVEPPSALKELSRFKANIIMLDIFFDELQTTEVWQSQSMTAIALLSNLGGTLGLWLGASLFTLLQFIVFLLKGCCNVLVKKKKATTNC